MGWVRGSGGRCSEGGGSDGGHASPPSDLRHPPSDLRHLPRRSVALVRRHGSCLAPGMLRPLAAGLVAGCFFWPWLQVPLAQAVAAAVALAALTVGSRSIAIANFSLGAAGVAVGFALVARIPSGPELRGEVSLRGVVASAGEGRRSHVLLAAAGPLGVPPGPASGRIRVVFPERAPPPGTVVLIAGFARRIDPTHLPGTPDPIVDATRAGVRSEVRATQVVPLGGDRPTPALDEARHAGLLRAFVDGDTAGVVSEDSLLLRRTGTWHLVSISGLHVGVGAALGWGAVWLFTRPLVVWRRHPRWRWVCAAGGIAGAVAYAELAEWGVPAQRAAWMTSVALLALAGSRRPDAGRTLALAAIAVLVADPACVGSLGFQLSFLALLGMMTVGPRIIRRVPPDLPRLARWLVASLATSLGATLGTLPVIALHIQQLSVLSPLANLWAIPWLGTIATPLAVFASGLDGAPRRVVLALADAAVDVGLAGLRLCDVAPASPAAGLAGAAALALTLALWRRELLALVCVAGVLLCPRAPSRDLVVTFLAIGQGDATLVEWPDGRRWLVDGGPPGRALLHWLRSRGIGRLDTVFLSHGHPDHYGGLLPVLAELPVDRLVAGALPEGQELSRVGVWTRDHPDLVPVPSDFVAEDENDRSLILRLRYGARSVLLPGDAEEAEEGAVVASGVDLRADVLKLAHHGSRTSSTEAWLAAVRPSVAIIPCGFDNRYGHPHAAVLQRLRTLVPAASIWRTDRDGSVEVRTDGADLRIRAIGVPAGYRLR